MTDSPPAPPSVPPYVGYPTVPAPPGPAPGPAPADGAQWSTAQKIGFRLLFTIGGGIVLLSILANAGLGTLFYYSKVWWLLAQLGSYLTRGTGVDVVTGVGGDQLWAWCMHLGIIVLGLIATAIWTALDRTRPNYRLLLGKLVAVAQFAVAASMIIYGMAKVLPTQMGFMTLPAHQLQLTGDTSLFNFLWGFMGASAAYSVITGLLELTAGLLLLLRRTTTLGLLLGVVAMTQVFLLNLLYDVPVKLVSGGLLLITAALLVPYLPNLRRVALNLGGVEPVPALPAVKRKSWGIVALILKYLLAALLLVSQAATGVLGVWMIHTPRSDLDGVWRATSFTIDGAQSDLTDHDPAPWTNVAITLRGSNTDGLKALSTAYDSFVTQTPAGYVTAWQLTEPQLEGDAGVFEIRRRADDAPTTLHVGLRGGVLTVTGELDGQRITGRYERREMQRDRSGFRLIAPTSAKERAPGEGG